MIRFRSIVATACVALLGVAGAIVVPHRAGAVEPPPQPDPDPAVVAKDQAAFQTLQAKKGALAKTHARAVVTGNWAAFDRDASAFNRELTGRDAMAVNRNGGIPPLAAYENNYLWVTQYPQEASNWCGPGSGKTITGYVSAFWGQGPPSQSQLAGWMGTGASGGVGTNISGFTAGVNAALGAGYYSYSVNLSPNNYKNSSWWWSTLTTNIDAWWPSGIDATEFWGVTYNGHPNPTSGSPLNRGHYIVNYGYWSASQGWAGGILSFSDPAANAPTIGWPGTQTAFSWGSNDFYNKFMGINWGSRGLTW